MSRTAEYRDGSLEMHHRDAVRTLRRAWQHYGRRHGRFPISADHGVFNMVRYESIGQSLREMTSTGVVDYDRARNFRRGLSAASDTPRSA